MSFKPFKALTTLLNGLKNKGTVLPGRNIPSFRTIASKQGIISYNPKNADYTSASHTSRDNFYVYPINHEDQEHYMLFDIIERVAEDGGSSKSVGNRGLTKRADNLDKVVYGANRFFGEGTSNLAFGIPTGKGSARNIKNTSHRSINGCV